MLELQAQADSYKKYQPYLSIVTTARNDNHGGNMLHRMQIFVNGVLAQSARHHLPTELIIVEWNPPPDKPRLAQDLSWPEAHDFCTLRIIEVPPELHQRYKHANTLPLYQMTAKNVGIRRARGEFILATNIDILFSDELFAFFANRNLEKGTLYRVNRHDVPSDIPLYVSIDEQLSYCRQNVIRMNTKYESFDTRTGEQNRIYPDDVDMNPPVYIDTECIALHTNACGDFQLMSRENWDIVYGYPELDMFSLHIDSVFSYMAHYGGAVEETLPEPMCIYHIEHEAGWKPEIQEVKTFEHRLKSSKIRNLSYEEFQKIIVLMTREKRHLILNRNDWGYASETLNEHIIVTARKSKKSQASHAHLVADQKGVTSITEQTSSSWLHNPPLASIVVMCLNGMPYIKNCIESILSQDYPYVECIVYDRGSTDGTGELSKMYGERITWVSSPGSGRAEALETALQQCKGEIVGVHDSDNELLPHSISWAVHYLGNLPDLGAIYGDYYEVDEQGKIIQGVIPGPLSFDYERILCGEDVIPLHSAFFRRSALEQAGLFDSPRLPRLCEDFALWLRLGRVAQIVHVPCTVSKYVVNSGSETCNPNTLHDIYNSKKEALKHFFLDPAVPLYLKSLRTRAMGGLALSVAKMFLTYFEDLISALGYIKLAHNEQIDVHRSIHPGETIHSPDFAQFCLQGEYLYDIRNYEEALAFYDSISILDYWAYGIQFSRATCLLQLGRVKDASLALQRELSLHPAHEMAGSLLEQISSIV